MAQRPSRRLAVKWKLEYENAGNPTNHQAKTLNDVC
jgi:hypothetical protein